MSENLKRAESLFNRIMNPTSNTANRTVNSSNGLGGSNISSFASSAATSATATNGLYGKSNGNNNFHESFSHNNRHNSHDHHQNHKSFHNKSHGKSSSSSSSSASNRNGHSHVNNSIPLVDLPKRDPVKISQDTVIEIPENHHVLSYCWSVWHHSRSKAKQQEKEREKEKEKEKEDDANPNVAAAVDSYLQTTNEIKFVDVNNSQQSVINIGSIEQLWLSLSSIKKSYELPIGSELLIFKSGVNPVWEDPINTKGGRWVFRFSRRSNNNEVNHELVKKVRHRTSLIWERLILKVLSGSIFPQSNYSEEIQELLLNDISGLVLSVRKDEDIISIWNSNLKFNFNKKKSFSEDGENKKILTSFQARRIICESILRVIRECDLIIQGSDCINTIDSGSNERVYGVLFEYRLHSDNNNPESSSSSSNNYNGHHNNHHHNHHGHSRRYNNKLYHHKEKFNSEESW